MKRLSIIFVTVLVAACSPSISSKLANTSYQKLNNNDKIYILQTSETLPEKSDFIGDFKIGDTGFTTDCGYEKVINEATNAARNAGANIIKIIELKEPSLLGSSCYRLKAKLYRNFDEASMMNVKDLATKKNKSRLPANSDYAIVYFYRPSAGPGGLLGYKIKNENDSIIGRVRSGERFEFKTKKFGTHKFYGELETKEEISINIEKGQEYFVRCSVNMGVVLGRPEIYLIENQRGIKEYNEMMKVSAPSNYKDED